MKKTQSQYSFGLASNRKMFRKGMTEGIPIAMGYLAVSFSLGIMAKRAGLSPFAAFLASFFNNASAGELCSIFPYHGGGILCRSRHYDVYRQCQISFDEHSPKPEDQTGGIDRTSLFGGI